MKIVKENIAQAVHYAQEHINESLTQIAEQFQIDRHTLSQYRNTDFDTWIYDADKKYYVTLEPHEQKSIEEFKNGTLKSAYQVKKKYGIHNDKFRLMCQYYGIEVGHANFKHTLNRNAFATIETEEDAYILGFITADGYLSETRNSLVIKLHSRDEDILRKICTYLEYDGEIQHLVHQQTHNILSNVRFCSSQLIQNLKKYGLHRKKSLQETFCTDMPEHLTRHYIRGLIDGDGFIKQSAKGIGLCGSQNITTNVAKYLIQELNLNIPLKIRREGESDLHRMEFSGNNAVKIMKYLYEDSRIYLDRKYELAKRYF
ncbi:MAG: LAGLIDADG family homing endonuclease [Agathobacter sp.]|nr:LAGLIDADG family homing endonuclease [Agathobacter sp.]